MVTVSALLLNSLLARSLACSSASACKSATFLLTLKVARWTNSEEDVIARRSEEVDRSQSPVETSTSSPACVGGACSNAV